MSFRAQARSAVDLEPRSHKHAWLNSTRCNTHARRPWFPSLRSYAAPPGMTSVEAHTGGEFSKTHHRYDESSPPFPEQIPQNEESSGFQTVCRKT
jgi:hypothetical protein